MRSSSPQLALLKFCKRGHDLTDPANRRTDNNGCAVCKRQADHQRHQREDVQAKYRERYRAKPPEQHAAKYRKWRLANIEYDRARTRRNHRNRRVGKDRLAGEYAAVLDSDPCCYCGHRPTSVDHIEAIKRGGTNTWSNLTAACFSCNSSKKASPLLWWMATNDHVRRQQAPQP